MTFDPIDREDMTPTDGSPALRALTRSTAREIPSSAAVARMAKHLVAAGVIAEPSPSSAPRLASWARHYALGALGLALVVGGGVAFWSTSSPSRPSAVASPSTASASPAGPLPKQVLADSPPAMPTAPEPASARGISVDDLPAPPSRSAAFVAPAHPPSGTTGDAPNARPSAVASAPPAATSTAVSELELMRRAEESFPADPERTLVIAAEHAQAYPHGQFVQEREVLAVEALARLGRRDEATRRALAVVDRFPRTPYAARLELATNRPLTRSRPSPSRP